MGHFHAVDAGKARLSLILFLSSLSTLSAFSALAFAFVAFAFAFALTATSASAAALGHGGHSLAACASHACLHLGVGWQVDPRSWRGVLIRWKQGSANYNQCFANKLRRHEPVGQRMTGKLSRHEP